MFNPRFVVFGEIGGHIQPMVANPVGEKITAALRAQGKSQLWLAEKLEVSNNAVSKWIKTGKISRNNAIRLSELLGMPLDDLLKSGIQAREPGATYQIEPEETRVLNLWRLLLDDQKEALFERLEKDAKDAQRVVEQVKKRLWDKAVPDAQVAKHISPAPPWGEERRTKVTELPPEEERRSKPWTLIKGPAQVEREKKGKK